MKKVIFSCFIVIFLFTNHLSSAQTKVTFYTNMGDFVVEMYDSLTPLTSGNFTDLVSQKFYDGIIFHRVIDGFMIQGGDPTGTGSGGPGYTIADEFDSLASNVQKTISMANAGPNTGGSQFFINLVDNTRLDFNKFPFTSKHAVFGICISGFSVVEDIGKVPVNSSDRPLTDVVMDSLRIIVPPSGIEDHSSDWLRIKIYPNPVTAESVISIDLDLEKQVTISIYDQIGRLLYQQEKNFSGYKNFIPAREFRLAPGLYHLRVSTGTSIARQKLVIVE